RPIVALDVGEGWSTRLADQSLDTRRDDRIHRAESARDAVALAQRLVASDSLGADAPTTPR
ncbi:MAG: hypothetical protein QGG40_11650, partial [Myxococcota bacterium]|nr:hypothetical protein [Myxococcota bacterium]